MSLTILTDRHTVEGIDYERRFDYAGHIGSWGFGFPCDAAGVLEPQRNPDAQANLDACLAGTNNTVDQGVIARPWSRRVPATGRCTCGRTVVLEGDAMGDTDCECGRIYNSSGQELNPRWMWGEETGESFGSAPGGDW
jgi:hypothetical protein